MNLLHIDSSILGSASTSRLLSAEIVAAWKAARPALSVRYRDLAVSPAPAVTAQALMAMGQGTPPADAAVAATLEGLGAVVDEFLAADVVVIGAPMYNFGIPVALKGWIDALAQPGRTFAYTADGPRGLAGGKQVVIASSRGNVYGLPPMSAFDFQEPYLAAVMRFFGIDRVDVVRAEGVSLGPDAKEAALLAARESIVALVRRAA